MNVAKFKLQLIQKILEVEDIQTLSTISKLIETYEQSQGNFSPIEELPFPQKTFTPKENIQDIQKDIEDVFGGAL